MEVNRYLKIFIGLGFIAMLFHISGFLLYKLTKLSDSTLEIYKICYSLLITIALIVTLTLYLRSKEAKS